MDKASLINASQLLNQDYLNAHLAFSTAKHHTTQILPNKDRELISSPQSQKIFASAMPNNINAAIADSGAFDYVPRTKETDTVLQLEKTAKSPVTSQNRDNSYKITSSPNIDRRQDKLIDVATRLTSDLKSSPNPVEVSMNQINDYQIWRDKDDIAIIDTKKNQLVAYGNNSADFFSQTIKNEELESFNTPDKLLGKISQTSPQINLQHDATSINDAYRQLRPLDPIFQTLNSIEIKPQKTKAKKIAESIDNVTRTVKKYAKNISQKLDRVAESVLFKAKERADDISATINSDRLMKHSWSKFSQAQQRTGENKYTFGEYTVEQTDDKNIQVLDKNQKLLVSFEIDRSKDERFPSLEMNFQLGNPTKLGKAVEVLRDPSQRGIGSKAVELQYQSQVFNVVRELASYQNGLSQLADSDKTMVKTSDSITVQDKSGNKLLVAEGAQNYSDLSFKQLAELKKVIKIDKNRHKQQGIVENVAPTIKKYLELNGLNLIDKDNFFASYNPQSKVLNYQDKTEPKIFLSAQLTDKGWKDLKTNISPAKEKYFENVKRKTDDYVRGRKSISESNQSVKRRAR